MHLHFAKPALLCGLLAGVLALAFPGAAHAQLDYDGAVDAAVSEYQAGHWPEARALFERAHELNPSARTHRGIGLCSFEVRDYVDAIVHLSASLGDSRRALTPELRTQVEETLERAYQFVGRYELVTEGPLEIVVDGEAFSLEDDTIDGMLILPIGSHLVVAGAPGYVTFRRPLPVRGGERERLELLLVPEPVMPAAASPRPTPTPVAPPPAPAAATEEEEGSTAVPTGAWALIGVGAAAVLSGVGTAVAASFAADEANEECPLGTSCSYLVEDTVTRAENLGIATDVLLSVGAATLVGGLAWAIVARRSGDDEGDTSVRPLLSPHLAGVALSTRY